MVGIRPNKKGVQGYLGRSKRGYRILSVKKKGAKERKRSGIRSCYLMDLKGVRGPQILSKKWETRSADWERTPYRQRTKEGREQVLHI